MFYVFVILVFFVSLKFLGLWEKPFSGLFAKANSSNKINVRHFAFSQCIAYLSSVLTTCPTVFIIKQLNKLHYVKE